MNRPPYSVSSPRLGPVRPALLLAVATTVVAGCYGPAGWESSAQRPCVRTYHPRETWRFRLTEGCSLPPGVVVPLCEQYEVLEVHDARRWRELRETLRLQGVSEDLDFSRGSVVGLAAVLGQPLSGDWPIHLDHVKLSHGLGSLTVRVEQGLYNPTRGSAYCVMAYVPGVERLAIVRVNHRLFYLE